MEQFELLQYLCRSLESIGVKYFITGSQATIIYGEPRFTNDIDVVVELEAFKVDAFAAQFPDEEFYLSREAIRQAINDRSMFNVIHPRSGLKIAFVVAPNSRFDRGRFERARPVQLDDDFAPVFSSPEDVILNKLEYYKIAESDKHLRDIAGVLKISGEKIDCDFIARGAAQLGVAELWQAVVARVEQ